MGAVPRTLMVMAGGTGGHIFPGLAVADAMRRRGWQVSWLGTAHGMENELVPRAGVEMDTIAFAGLRGKGLMHSLKGALALVKSFFSTSAILRRRKPDVLIGMGGYVTVPGGVMARLSGRPLALVNADAAPLLSNRLLAPFARRVLFGFAGEFGGLAAKAIVTGNPVRREIAALAAPDVRYADRSGVLRILVVGGSLGARVLNEAVPLALAKFEPALRPQVTHQAGKAHGAALREAYALAGVEAELVDFIDDMPRRLAEADLVICRAGAITVAELAVAGVASVLVPFLASTTSHQRDNAVYFAKSGAAIHLPQTELSAERLAEILRTTDRARCLEMATAARALGRPDATERIADILSELAEAGR
ncbi:undecaprenyldiphospho-muramoylpentapeptide beta-N-acetylglucosaminyltransferase [Niveibacterium sp. SC-1]|uniref:undecaprenyldiphospho-muramoylpentapeptide beta-N-acetylglucosaminyltransferase n=1 Tax=Niveibacterium sp. SC-1 TaxID=3135646 RepID=UPI00311F74EC